MNNSTKAESAPVSRNRMASLIEGSGLVLLTLIAIAFFSFLPSTSGTFPSAANFQAIVGNQTVLAVATLAILIPLVCEQYDLSVGANLGLSAVLGATVMSHGGPLFLAIAVAIGSGAVFGLINSILVLKAGVNAVVVTLGTALVMVGAVNWITDGQAIISGIPPGLIAFGAGNFLGIPNIFWVALVLFILAWRMMEHMPIGRYLYALGSNPDAARLSGLNTERLITFSFVAAGVLAGIAGILLVARNGGASPRIGDTITLPAFAAAFLSAAAIKPGQYNAFGALVALVFLAVLNSGLNLAGAPPHVSSIVNGIALITGVALAHWLGRRRGKGAT